MSFVREVISIVSFTQRIHHQWFYSKLINSFSLKCDTGNCHHGCFNCLFVMASSLTSVRGRPAKGASPVASSNAAIPMLYKRVKNKKNNNNNNNDNNDYK